jgi:hypothetical protein
MKQKDEVIRKKLTEVRGMSDGFVTNTEIQDSEVLKKKASVSMNTAE